MLQTQPVPQGTQPCKCGKIPVMLISLGTSLTYQVRCYACGYQASISPDEDWAVKFWNMKLAEGLEQSIEARIG
jgi:hypothetical protein